jgi:Bacterial lectin/Legume lectin domain/Chitobiase/beta-hexosaminidase C-terminal domain
LQTISGAVSRQSAGGSWDIRILLGRILGVAGLFAFALAGSSAAAQVNVLTSHNDIARTGQNLNETILTPSNVNSSQFGRLFSQPVTGSIFGQPLYAYQVAIPGKGTHNVLYVATGSGSNGSEEPVLGDDVYAFDADTNGGANATPLWHTSLLTSTASVPEFGVIGTPVIDLGSQTMYLVSSELQGATPIYRFHALDITSGAEKFGGPLLIQASVPGTGVGSAGGILTFNASYEYQRPGLLFLNGIVYVSFGSVSDQGPWHGWLFSFGLKPGTQTLQQIDTFCTTPNGMGGGFWMGGAGLVAEVYNSAKPYGRMFISTGNGSYGINAPTVSGEPYSSPANEYSMSVLDLDLTGGVMTVEDGFAPFNEATLDAQDGDLGSGGPVLLPTQTLASGKVLHPLLQIGKSGMVYILDRDNNTDGSNNPATEYSPAGLGGFNASGDQDVQEVQTPITPGANWGAGVWGTEAYWNNNIYSGGTLSSASNNLTAYSFTNGVLSAAPTSETPDLFSYAGPTPSVSANGTTNGILWALRTGASVETPGVLLAYDATNLANRLYSSSTNLIQDALGNAKEFAVPTIANGKVYVGAQGQVSIYGLLGATPVAPSPVINPGSGTFSTPPAVTITDSLDGATIYYTTDGSIPNSSSPVYQSTSPPVVSANETVTAIASATGYLLSAPASATYESTSTPANPVFSLAVGSYIGAQTLTITDSTPGAVIYYTVDGPAPTSASAVYTQPISITASEVVQAVAIAPGSFASSVISAAYTVQPVGTISFPEGFTLAQGPMQFNGTTDLDDFRLQLTNGGTYEAGSTFYATPVNIQQFTTQFTFQLSNPAADGITFAIQNNGPTAVGGNGGSLGYAGIPNSVAIKFDLYSNAGEGPNSTGLYINGAAPTVPAINLTGTGIDLHSGDYFNATITYDGANLTLTLTDGLTLATWSNTWVINIPAIVGGNTAYVGFTGGTGALTASQKLTYWTYVPGPPVPTYPTGFNGAGMVLNGGAALSGTRLRLTDGNPNEARSAYFATPVNIQQFNTSFSFQLTDATADGFTFTIQGEGPTAVGPTGGSLGYQGITNSLAVKFDIFSNIGEGSDSTGLYLDGAQPTLPAINLSPTGVILYGGDIFNVQINYDGATLTVVITDTVTNASATQTYSVNIPATVGGNTAYVGFTGASGGLTAIQDILSWSFSPVPISGLIFSNGFATSASQLTLNGGAILNGTRLRLTDGNANEARSTFYTTPVNIQQFSTGFDFQLTNPNADGFTFTIQGKGPTAVGGVGGSLGYAGIPTSVAVKFDLYSNEGEGPDSTGLYTNGVGPFLPDVNLSTTGINLHSGDIFNAQLTYTGTTLTVVITDTVTNASATQTYNVNIPAIVGGNIAYVGFTGGSGGLTAIQEILNWSYSTAPISGPTFSSGFATSGSQLTLNGGATLNGNTLQLTDGSPNEARSAFYSTPVNVQQFSTDFYFQLTNPNADGFTFTIEGDGPTVVGGVGGSLGYAGIPTSVAVKFDLYNNEGEGPDSTGLYTNGTGPFLPDVNLSTTGINLHSGDIFNVQLNYNGATLTVLITDTVTKAVATQTYSVNIPTIVGGNTAYVGFTGGSGGLTAVQEILSWTYSPGTVI